MENKIQELKKTHLKINELMKELDEAIQVEAIKKDFPEAKLFSFEKEFENKKFKVKFLKLVPDVSVTIYLSTLAFLKFMFKENSLKFNQQKYLQGRITEFEKSELQKIRIFSVEEIGVC